MRRLWRTGSRRVAPRRGASTALVGSMVLHTVAGTLVLMPPAEPSVVLPTYRVQLLAAPRPTPQQRRAPEVVQRPPAPAVATRPRSQPKPTPEPPPTPPVETKSEPAARTNPDSLAPDVEPSTGSDAATVSTSGVEFPFPEYLRNLVAQVHRRLPGRLEILLLGILPVARCSPYVPCGDMSSSILKVVYWPMIRKYQFKFQWPL